MCPRIAKIVAPPGLQEPSRRTDLAAVSPRCQATLTPKGGMLGLPGSFRQYLHVVLSRRKGCIRSVLLAVTARSNVSSPINKFLLIPIIGLVPSRDLPTVASSHVSN